MSVVILQMPSSYETRAVRVAAMLLDNMEVVNATFDGLIEHAAILKDGALPVGNVEFVREAMRLSGIQEPENISYPQECRKYLCRDVRRTDAGLVIGRWFVKPVQTKAFTGFVFDTMQDPSRLSEHDQEQHAAFLAMPANSPVWISEPVQWLSEWRYYVAYGEVIGKARYDPDGTDDAPVPDDCVIRKCIRDLAINHPYALDFGVLSTNETALVEVNDAWAIGLYQNALSNRDYFYFLRSRWRMFFNN